MEQSLRYLHKIEPMGKKVDPEKIQLAYMLFMAGEMQKVIAERTGLSEVTISKYARIDNWDMKRAAKTVTKGELVNKILNQIAATLDNAEGKSIEEVEALADKLSKLVSSLTKLDKQSSVVDDMDTFMAFNTWCKRRMEVDKELTMDLYKAINKYQDAYINERLSQK